VTKHIDRLFRPVGYQNIQNYVVKEIKEVEIIRPFVFSDVNLHSPKAPSGSHPIPPPSSARLTDLRTPCRKDNFLIGQDGMGIDRAKIRRDVKVFFVVLSGSGRMDQDGILAFICWLMISRLNFYPPRYSRFIFIRLVLSEVRSFTFQPSSFPPLP